VIDAMILHFDRALRTVMAPARSVRPIPGEQLPEADLNEQERKHAAALMRINHVGEVCAQALYQGQAIVSRDAGIKRALEKAAAEEVEHLAWTESRIAALGGRKSVLNPVWYLGALGIGVFAGKFGDRWNLGFLAETERQVESHLQSHLDSLPPQDARSRAILDQMASDEIAHAQLATALGGAPLPEAAKTAMRGAAQVMKRLAYWV
jgi:ubiquinone biosynthesis monooxygenase Coq7